MKGLTKLFQQDTFGLLSFWVSSILFLSIIVGVAIIFAQLPPYVPLYNHMPWGYARIGNKWEILLPLGIALMLCITNTVIAIKIRNTVILLARFLYAANIALSLFSLIFILRLFQTIL